MKISVARKVDEYVGPVACRLMLLLRAFAPPRPGVSPASPVDIRRILVVKYFGMGSILLASPALTALKRRYPHATVTMLTLTTNREMCHLLPAIDHVVCADLRSLIVFAAGFLRALYLLRRTRWDVIIDLEFLTNFSALTTLLVNSFGRKAVTVGFHSPIGWRNRVYTRSVSFDHSRHISRIFMKVANSVCADINGEEVCFDSERGSLLAAADPSRIDEYLAANTANGTRPDRIVCMNVNAGVLSYHRRWPREHFAELLNGLLARADSGVVLIGGNDDRDYVAGICAGHESDPRVENLCGKTTISQLIGLLARCDLLVTNDSGPLHVAHVVGTPTVSLFGPETPYLYGPLGTDHHVFYSDRYCSPCLNIYESKLSDCRDNLCLRCITPAQVYRVIEDRFRESRRDPKTPAEATGLTAR